MKRKFCAALALLLCLSLCLILAPGAFAEGEGTYPVRFYNEKNYDLVGLTVTAADGSEIAPAETGDGYTYLLAPGAYSYAYHDSRGIFLDIEETGFTVGDDAQEIPVALKASFEDNYHSTWISARLSEGGDDEATIRAAMPAREEVIDRLAETLIEKANDDTGSFFVSDNSVFNSPPGYDSDAALQLRAAMVDRQAEVEFNFETTAEWSWDDFDTAYFDTLLAAIQHTGNPLEGDTLKKVLSSSGASYSKRFDGTKYNNIIVISLLYKTSREQELATEDTIAEVIASLNLTGKSDYEKASAIHQWLYTYVNYDWEHYQDDSYKLQFTDYAALVEHVAVCQGIATAYYRLCLAAGLDARYVSSYELHHGWNVVRVNGTYYEADATWDSNTRERHYSVPLPNYFLRGSTWWNTGHTDESGYSTIGDEFINDSYTKYDPNGLDYLFLRAQYADFDTYTLSAADFDPASVVPTGVAVNETNFPDSIFRAYVSENFDTDGNGYLSDSEIQDVTTIDVSYSGTVNTEKIGSLKGVEHFVNLLFLDCAGNALTELDVSQNTQLGGLICGIMDNDGNVFGNQLSSLSLSNNTQLEYLYCTHNQISSLDVSGNTALAVLYCYNNGMTQLNIRGCTELTELSCGNNQLTSLDVSGNTALANLYCYNNNLRTLTVKNHPSLAFLQCSANPLLGTLDVSGCTKLANLYCQNCGLSILNVNGCTQLKQVGCANNSLSTLDFSTCANLRDLGCQDNSLVSLNLTGCGLLSGLGCRDNQLNTLDLSTCVNLVGLICSGNPLTSVDLTPCPALVRLMYTAEPTETDGLVSYTDDNGLITCDSTLSLLVTNLLELPADLAVIEDEAFAGGSFAYVVVPEGTVSVGPRAFANCPNLAYIFVRSAETAIDPSAFEGSNNVNVITPAA